MSEIDDSTKINCRIDYDIKFQNNFDKLVTENKQGKKLILKLSLLIDECCYSKQIYKSNEPMYDHILQ